MATRLAILIALLTVQTLFAGRSIFSYHRFGDIVLRTDAGKESVLIEYGGEGRAPPNHIQIPLAPNS